ncbi:MAG: 2-oxoacid:ferredoxin oxidoreductase subunit beta [Candidatus Saliniplasma sp.]
MGEKKEERNTQEIREKYLRKDMMPTIFCTGCGIGNVLNYTLRAIEKEGLDMDKTVILSGIGCSSRLPGYVDVDSLHTTHGRALAFATGVKITNPDLNVIVFTGDGDCMGIGGNHFIHAARRNIDMTVIAVNNFIYGMTGGQVAPTTPEGDYATTAPFGNIEPPFDMSNMAISSGASYVARWTVTKPSQPINSIAEAIANKGFSFVEMLSPCTTAYARQNKVGSLREFWNWYDKKTILTEDYEMLKKYGDPEEIEKLYENIETGVLHKEEKECLSDRMKRLIEEVQV